MSDWREVVAQIEALEDEELLLLEPREQFDPCLVGLAERFHSHFAVYSRKAVISAIAEEEMLDQDEESDEDVATNALEHYQYNIVGGWVGEGTPAFLMDDDD